MLRHPAVIAVAMGGLAWLIVIVVVVTNSDVHPDPEPATGLPTISYTDCWPDFDQKALR